MSSKMSEAMRKRWANPEWAARQRAKIAAGMQASDNVKRVEHVDRAWRPGDPKPERKP